MDPGLMRSHPTGTWISSIAQGPGYHECPALPLIFLALISDSWTDQCVQVPLARSETHLNELLDGVCNSMSDYALYVDPDTQHKQYKRFAPRESGFTGDFPDFKNFQFAGPETTPNPLKFACETLVEELEDDIISLFSQDAEHVHEELCNRVSEYCSDSSHANEEL